MGALFAGQQSIAPSYAAHAHHQYGSPALGSHLPYKHLFAWEVADYFLENHTVRAGWLICNSTSEIASLPALWLTHSTSVVFLRVVCHVPYELLFACKVAGRQMFACEVADESLEDHAGSAGWLTCKRTSHTVAWQQHRLLLPPLWPYAGTHLAQGSCCLCRELSSAWWACSHRPGLMKNQRLPDARATADSLHAAGGAPVGLQQVCV